MTINVDLFALAREKGFVPARLDILCPDDSFVSMGLLQHRGKLIATPAQIANEDTAGAITRHVDYLRLMKVTEPVPALAVTPEYSTPWAAIHQALQSQLYPRHGSLWILGCESITPGQLEEFIATHPEIFWLSDVDTLETAGKTFLDPVLLVFRGHEIGGTRSIAIGIQFKTHAMGGDEAKIERDHLITGTTRYFLRNLDEPSIRLVTLLCSDSLNFSITELNDYAYHPHLVVHAQCTPNVNRTILKKYRDDLYATNAGGRYGCLALNWARGSSFGDAQNQWAFGGSSFHFRPDKDKRGKEPRQTDVVLDAIHYSGIYLKFSPETPQNASYYLSADELVFVLRATKVDQFHSVGTQDKAGVLAASAYLWNSQSTRWEPLNNVEDGVSHRILQLKSHSLLSVVEKPSERERLLSFSTGNFDCRPQWHQPYQFRSYRVSLGQEMPEGTLVFLRQEQEMHIDRALQQFKTLESVVIKDHVATAPPFSGLAGKAITLAMSIDGNGNFVSNLMVDGESAYGAAMYIGEASKDSAKRLLEEFNSNLQPNRAAIWFRDSGVLQHVSTSARSFAIPRQDSRSISAEQKP